MPLSTEQIVENRYRIVELLGQGGFGAVYRAWDLRLNRSIALKEMTPQSGLDVDKLDQLRQQFRQEAQIVAKFIHPNLARVTDYFTWENNEYLVMDFIAGENLAELIEREGAQPEAQVWIWTEQLLSALAYCHEQGILHRDIKPQNIIITPDGRAVLVDFGLVKLWNPSDPQTRTVMRGAGTPEYAPPEQYDMGMGHTDPRSDIYSLGATIYHALTGQTPPTATQRMASPTSFAPPRRVNASITSNTEGVVLKALEIAMEDRYQSAAGMKRALKTEPPQPRHTTPIAQPTPMSAPHTPEAQKSGKGRFLLSGAGLLVGLVCLALAGGAALIGGILLYNREATPPSPTFSPPTNTPTATLVTPTRPPTSTPQPDNTQDSTSQILLQDNFDDPSSGWEVGDYEGGSVGYKDGVYFVRSEKNGVAMWGESSQSFKNVSIEVDTTQITAGPTNDNAYGVKCREQNDDGYGFMISGDGYYSIQVIVNGDWNQLVEWTSSSMIRQGNATNHIRAVCNDNRLALFVNGELLAETKDSTYSEGNISLAAGTLEEEPTEIHFDNLIIHRPTRSTTVLFQDDFGSSGSGWETGSYDTGSVGYADGTYYVTSSEKEQMMWGLANLSFEDIIIEVDAAQVSAPANNNNAYGVMCRVQSDDDGYLLRISGDGYYAIHVIIDEEFESLVDWAISDAIRQGNANNHIRAICDGNYLALSVNGELLAEIEDDTFAKGDIALTATTFEEDSSEVRFDDLTAYAP